MRTYNPAWFAAVCLLMGCRLAIAAAAQDSDSPQITTLKVVTGLVAISAVVKSKSGDAREDLTKDDFVLKQDGKEEPISYFSKGSALPLSLALMVDTSGSQQTFVGDETIAGDVFFDTMLEHVEDRATLVEFDSTIQQLRRMTGVPNDLHLALSRLNTRPAATTGTLLYDAVYVAAKNLLAGEKGRRAMVILSDGGDNGSRHTLAEAIEQAQRADVQIYSIRYSLWDEVNGNGGVPLTADPGLGALQKLSESTGGRVFTVSRTVSLRDIFAQIGQDLRLQYEIGYKPPAETAPNSYHKLELKAKEKKLTVQARKGFFEPP